MILMSRKGQTRHPAPGLLLSGLLSLGLGLTTFGCDDEGGAVREDVDGSMDHDHGDHDHDAGGDREHDGGGDAGHMHGDAGRVESCGDDIPAFEEGLEVHSANLLVRLVSAEYNPPQKYENDWVVLVANHDGTPIEDAQLTDVEAFMPVHGHDGKYPPTVNPVEGEPGQFKLDDLYFTMEGPWEVRFTVSSESAGDDYVVFEVCVGA